VSSITAANSVDVGYPLTCAENHFLRDIALNLRLKAGLGTELLSGAMPLETPSVLKKANLSVFTLCSGLRAYSGASQDGVIL